MKHRHPFLASRLLTLTIILTFAVDSVLSDPPSQDDQRQSTIELTLVDNQTIGYATFQSHNQKVVSGPWGVFITYIRQSNANYTTQEWRLAHSVDGGKSFATVLADTGATSDPALETHQQGTLFFARPDFKDGNAYLSRINSLGVQPVTTTLAGGSAGKYCMVLDAPRKQLYFFAHNGSFHMVGVDGQVRYTTQLFANGKCASLMYPHLTLGREGTLYAARVDVSLYQYIQNISTSNTGFLTIGEYDRRWLVRGRSQFISICVQSFISTDI